jgi:hypothetical protein
LAAPPLPPGRIRLLSAIVGTAWLLLVSVVVFWPVPVDAGMAGALERTLAWLHASGPLEWMSYSLIETAANGVLFLPLGACLVILLPPGRRWWSPCACLLVSLVIEVGQLALLPHRFATAQDVAANTAGAVAGAAAAWCWLRRRRVRRARVRRAGRGGGRSADG